MRKGWEYKKLGEVCCPKSKIQRATKCFGGSDEILYIDISSIDNSVQEVNSITSFTMSNAPSRAQQKVEYGDIIVSTVRPNLKNVAFIKQHDSNLVVSSGFCVLRTTDDIERNYLFRYITSDIFTQHLMKLTTGANYPAVRDLDVRDSTIPLPPKSTQLAIVSELDKINELIRLKKEQLKDFDNLAQSLFYEMFGDPVENEKGWEVKKLGDCFSYIKNGANIKQTKDVDGFPITRIETLAGGIFNRDRMGYAGIYDLSKYSAYVLESRDLLMSHINSKTYIGRTVEYKRNNDETIIHGMNLLRLKAIHDIIDSTFFVYYTKSGDFKSKIARIRKDAVNQSSFAISDLKRLNIPLPPLSLQRLFAQRIEQIEREKSEVQKSIQDLETLLASRMQYWFE